MNVTADDIQAAFKTVTVRFDHFEHGRPLPQETIELLEQVAAGKHDQAVSAFVQRGPQLRRMTFGGPDATRSVRIFAGVAVACSDVSSTITPQEFRDVTFHFMWNLRIGDGNKLVTDGLKSQTAWKIVTKGCQLAGLDPYLLALELGLWAAGCALCEGARRTLLNPSLDDGDPLFGRSPTMFDDFDTSIPQFAARLVAKTGIPDGATVKWLGGISVAAIAGHLGLDTLATQLLESLSPDVQDAPIGELADAIRAISNTEHP